MHGDDTTWGSGSEEKLIMLQLYPGSIKKPGPVELM
jgi:hypothetical protein